MIPARSRVGGEPRDRFSGLALAATTLLPLLTGCPGSLEGTFPPPVGTNTGTGGSSGVCDAPATVFAVHCGGLGCHQPGSQVPDLLTAPVEVGLINKTAMFMCPGVTDQLYVDPGKPASGVLFLRITGATCIDQMPQGQPALGAADIQCVTDWVTSKLP